MGSHVYGAHFASPLYTSKITYSARHQPCHRMRVRAHHSLMQYKPDGSGNFLGNNINAIHKCICIHQDVPCQRAAGKKTPTISHIASKLDGMAYVHSCCFVYTWTAFVWARKACSMYGKIAGTLVLKGLVAHLPHNKIAMCPYIR